MKRWKMVSLICLASALLLAGLVAFVLPGIVKSQAVRRVEAVTGRTLGIGAVSLNPFTLTVTVRDFRLSERGSAETFAAFSSARVTVSPASLYRRTHVLAATRLTAPHLRIVRVGSNLYNFSDLLKFLPLHPRLTVSNLTVTNGSADFLDRGLAVEKRHELSKIELTVPFITTMPQYADRFVAPRLSGVLNGSPFHLEAKLRPFPRAVEATATVEFQDASLPYYLAYLPVPLPVTVPSGRLSTKLALSYRVAQQESPQFSLSGSLALSGLKLAGPTGAPLLSVARLDAGVTRATLPGGDFDLNSLAADGLEVFLTRDRQGVWSLRRLLKEASPGAAPRRKVLAAVKQMRVRHGRLHFRDDLPSGGFSTELTGISLDMQDYSTSPGKRASYALTFGTLRGERADLKGAFSPRPWASSSAVRLTGVPLEAYSPYLAWVERFEVKGKFTFAGDLDYSLQQGLKLDQVSVQARPFATLVGGKARITRSALSLSGLRYSREANLLQVDDAALKEGEIRFSRDRNGGLRPLANPKVKGRAPARGKRPGPLQYRIGSLTGTGMSAVFTDERLAARPDFALQKLAFSLEKLNGPHFGPSPFRAAGSYGKEGSVRASGSLIQTPLSFKGDLKLHRLPLTDFQCYLPDKLNLSVANGSLDARLAGSLTSKAHRLSGSYGGSAGIHSLRLLDAGGGELLKVEKIQLDQIKGSLEPRSLDLGAVTLTGIRTRIVVAENGNLNFQHLFTREPEGKEAEAVAAKTPLPLRVGTVTIEDSTLAFTDNHVQGGYTTTLFNLGGRVSGLSPEENRFADLDLSGDLEHRAPLRITGLINPLRQNLFADIKVSFTGIELPPMTPYSGTYLGYAVDRGKLYLDSRYRIVNRKLNSENHVFIDQLDLGKRIESEKATTLPVRLAVALLKDRKGEIRLDLPVLGQTDDPKFSVWGVVLKALKGLVVKAATSPFALFQAMFGTKEELSLVLFAPGSATLSPAEQQKLLKLATALNDRPALKAKVAGFADRERDGDGYREAVLQKKMRAEKFLAQQRKGKNQPGDSPEALHIEAGEYSRYLKAVYDKEEFPKPRNLLGRVRALPDAEMKQLILAHTAAGDQQMRGLAEARAAGVRAFLVEQGGISAARVIQTDGDIYRTFARGGAPGSRVELELAVQ
jgi:uncharacterized protein involved in outer membrane biogenesis/outer membrane protein OmpA-like peptidoglycan-associated protein